jgi:hypothetical protein
VEVKNGVDPCPQRLLAVEIPCSEVLHSFVW